VDGVKRHGIAEQTYLSLEEKIRRDGGVNKVERLKTTEPEVLIQTAN
jgi:hypothetical protein